MGDDDAKLSAPEEGAATEDAVLEALWDQIETCEQDAGPPRPEPEPASTHEGSNDLKAAARWTVPMALAWIATRNLDEVQSLRRENGNPPATWEDFELARVYEAENGAPADVHSPATAWTALRNALSAGSLNSEGFKGDDDAVAIGAGNWPAMKYGADPALGFICRPHDVHGGFHGVTMLGEDVRRLWPATVAEIDEAQLVELLAPIEQSEEQARPALAKSTVADSGAADQAQHSAKRRGRSPIYPWAEFQAAALERLEYEGGLGAAIGFTQADLESHMIEWCATHWVGQPVESTIRLKVSEARDTYKAGKVR